MVQVKDGSTTVASYQYNGLNHRVRKIVGSETRLFYFNQDWQCLEERIGTTTDTQYVWGLRYIDDLVCRDKGSVRLYSLHDPNWNVVALCDTSGVVKERYVYSSFGKTTVLNASFASQSPTTYSWNRLFTGQVLDAETGLMLYRNRFYHNGLGRFVTRDPIGYGAGDMNVLRYVLNKPSSMVDFLGWEGFENLAPGFGMSQEDILYQTAKKPPTPKPPKPPKPPTPKKPEPCLVSLNDCLAEAEKNVVFCKADSEEGCNSSFFGGIGRILYYGAADGFVWGGTAAGAAGGAGAVIGGVTGGAAGAGTGAGLGAGVGLIFGGISGGANGAWTGRERGYRACLDKAYQGCDVKANKEKRDCYLLHQKVA